MSWDDARKAKDEGGIFIKLKDGDQIEGVFVGEPHCFYSKFGDRQEFTKWQEGLSFKFRINFFVKTEDGWNPKILTGGATVRDSLLDLRDEYGMDCIYKVKRVGSGKEDTRYPILFKAKLTDEQKADIELIEPKDLTSKGQKDEESPF